MVELNELGARELKRIEGAPADFLNKLNKINAKRAKFVISEILEHGYCTTERIQEAGYNHPPRAARDVRENGISLVTETYKGEDGKSLGVYYFGDFESEPMASKASGRTVLGNALKQSLIDKYGSKCFLFLEELDDHDLQIDHRIPYEIAGEQDESNIDNFMLLSASANRRKSWSCEHCPNWSEKDPTRCASCFWAHPECYEHVACKPGRQISYVLSNESAIAEFDGIVKKVGRELAINVLREAAETLLAEMDASSTIADSSTDNS